MILLILKAIEAAHFFFKACPLFGTKETIEGALSKPTRFSGTFTLREKQGQYQMTRY